jgi:hypothetical protein
MDAISSFMFPSGMSYDEYTVKMLGDLTKPEKSMVNELSEALKQGKGLIEKMKKFKMYLSSTVFEDLVNRRQTQYGCLKLESYSPNEIIKLYGNEELHHLKLFAQKSKVGITLELFILFNFELFTVDTEEDYFFLVNGLLKLFHSIVCEGKRTKERALKEYLLTERSLREELYADIKPETMTRNEYMNALFFRTRIHGKINLNAFVDGHLEKFLITHDDILFHFLNGQKFLLSHISY